MHRHEYQGLWATALLVCLLLLSIYVFGLVLGTWRNPSLSRTKRWAYFQIVCDILLFTALYWFTRTPESDFFLFYFLPIFIAADSLGDGETLISFMFVSLSLLVVVLILAHSEPRISDQIQLTSSGAILRIFLPRVTFYLAVLYLALVQRARLKSRTAQLATLREVDIRIHQQLEDPQSLQVIAEECRRFFKAESCHIRLKEGVTLRLVAGAGSYYKVARQIIAIDEANPSGSVRAYVSRSPYIVQHAEQDRFFADFRHQISDKESQQALLRVRSFGCFPLEIEGEIIGVLTLKFLRSSALSEETCESIQDFGRRAAVAIYNAHLLGEARRRLHDSERLLEVSRQITQLKVQEDHLYRILQTVVEAAKNAIPQADKGSIYLLDKKEGILRLVASLGFPPEIIASLVFRLGEGIVGQAVQTGIACVANDFQSDPRTVGSKIYPETAAIRSCACVPICGQGGAIGAICLDSTREMAAFSNVDIQLMLAYAGQAAIATENATLFDTARRHINLLAALNKIGHVLSSALNLRPEEIIQSIYQQVKDAQLMDVTSFYVATYDLLNDSVDFIFAVENGGPVAVGTGEWQSRRGGNGLTEYVVRHEKAVIIPNNVDRWLADNSVDSIGRPARSWLGVPIMAEGVMLGVMAVQNYEREFAFDEAHLLVLATIGSWTAAVLQNQSTFRELQNMRDRWSAVVTSTPDAIIAMDMEGQVTAFSQRSEDLLKHQRIEIQHHPAAQLFWNGQEDLDKIFSGVLGSRDRRTEYEIFLRSVGGERIPVYLTASPIFSDQQQVVGIVAVLRDLRLSAMKGRIRDVFDTIARIDSHTDLGRIQETVVLEIVSLLGGDTGCLLVHEGDMLVPRAVFGTSGFATERQLVRETDSVIGMALRKKRTQAVSRSDGSGMFVPLSEQGQCELAIPLLIEDLVLGFLLIESQTADWFKPEDTEVLDLADLLARQAAIAMSRSQLSEQQVRAQRTLLRTSNTVAAGQIALGMAHEVKNGLNNIALGITLLTESIQKEPGVRNKKKYTDELESAGAEIIRMSRLAQRLQKFSQRIEPQKTKCYLNAIVRDTIESMTGTLSDHDIGCDLRLTAALDAPSSGSGGHPIWVDERQIRQVIINLVLNAIDVSPSRAKIVIRTELLAAEAVMHVTDHGKGIQPELKRQLFQPFFSTKAEGTGLGLYVCRLIVEDNHQGKIELDTKPGKGTTFSVRIPLTQEPA